MSTHYKVDLYNQAQLAALDTKIGDILTLSVPQPDMKFKQTTCKVIAMETDEVDASPLTGEQTFRVILTLEDQ